MKSTCEAQTWYLLLHYGVPTTSSGYSLKSHFQEVHRACRPVGVTVTPIEAVYDKGSSQRLHYLFRFTRYKRDDKRALTFAESFSYAFAVVAFPLVESDQDGFVFRIPRSLVGPHATVSLKKLLDIAEKEPPDLLTLDFPLATLTRIASTSVDRFEAAWRLTALLLTDLNLFNAARFWKASQDQFCIYPGEVPAVIEAADTGPRTQNDQTRFESALHQAFKAIEALIGDPPKGDNKFFQKIESIGLDPHEKVGYQTKRELHEVIREMNKARDKKSAHGSTVDRTITLGEMFEYHSCARYVVCSAMQTRLGRPLF